MFKQTAVKQCFVGFLALAAAACSSTDTRTRSSDRVMLPSSPVPQVRTRAPRNIYVPPAFEEYQPQQPAYGNSQDSYGAYAPPKEYRDDYYTGTVERQPPAVVEVLRPPQPEVMQAIPVEPLTTRIEREEVNNNELDIDPFAAVPDREVVSAKSRVSAAAPTSQRSTQTMSRAAKALSLAAKAESAVGRTDAAINKVERALRIEPRSAALWYQLAELNFKKGRYDQAVGFARKSLPLASGNRNLRNQSLNLMSKAAVKAGNTKVFKEVLDYKKQNF